MKKQKTRHMSTHMTPVKKGIEYLKKILYESWNSVNFEYQQFHIKNALQITAKAERELVKEKLTRLLKQISQLKEKLAFSELKEETHKGVVKTRGETIKQLKKENEELKERLKPLDVVEIINKGFEDKQKLKSK